MAHAEKPFRSLQVRLLLPLLVVALLAALAVAAVSYLMANRWSKQQLAFRFEGISDALADPAIPLKSNVVDLLSKLTSTELITIDQDGRVLDSSLPLGKGFQGSLLPSEGLKFSDPVRIGDKEFIVGTFARRSTDSTDRVHQVAVLFENSSLRAARFRAAGLPLVVGLSTLFLLTSVMLLMGRRLIHRLQNLSSKVDQIAQGSFQTEIPPDTHDEIGLLGNSVRRMGVQLDTMWQQLSRTQGQKLLHQIAGGLAHQLRNSLTGARMGIELHARDCSTKDDKLQMALTQLEQTEDHVRRLLLAAAGKQDVDRPGPARQCLDDIRSGLGATADHLHVSLTWDLSDEIEQDEVSDAPSLSAAVSNLVMNAIQEAESKVIVVAKTAHQSDANSKASRSLVIKVFDDGPGPSVDLSKDLFEPFVTTKPEGLGLGLPLVARAADRLGGEVKWERRGSETCFTFTARLIETTSERN